MFVPSALILVADVTSILYTYGSNTDWDVVCASFRGLLILVNFFTL